MLTRAQVSASDAASAALAVPAAASAKARPWVTLPVDDSIVFAGADSPCGFDITFTSAGTIKATTSSTTRATRCDRRSTAR